MSIVATVAHLSYCWALVQTVAQKWIRSRGSGVTEELWRKVGVRFSQIFSIHYRRNYVAYENIFEMHRWYGPPLWPYRVGPYGTVGTLPPPGGAKKVQCLLFVCPSRFLNGKVCANDFATKEFELETLLTPWIGGRFQLCIRVQLCAYATRWRHHRMLKSKFGKIWFRRPRMKNTTHAENRFYLLTKLVNENDIIRQRTISLRPGSTTQQQSDRQRRID